MARPRLESLARAKARLDRLDYYPRPVRIDRVRVFVTPLLFRLPWFRRFDGYAAWNTIFLEFGDHSGWTPSKTELSVS